MLRQKACYSNYFNARKHTGINWDMCECKNLHFTCAMASARTFFWCIPQTQTHTHTRTHLWWYTHLYVRIALTYALFWCLSALPRAFVVPFLPPPLQLFALKCSSACKTNTKAPKFMQCINASADKGMPAGWVGKKHNPSCELFQIYVRKCTFLLMA